VSSSDATLRRIANSAETPAYVYDLTALAGRFETLRRAMGRQFGVSYAVKANPNIGLLKAILPHVATFDVSSYREVERALEAGCPAHRITFSGPAKRVDEIRGAVAAGIGELVLESVAEARTADAAAREFGTRQPVLVRINPATSPRYFGVNFSGKATQFGIDEEVLDEALDAILGLANLELIGFHIYSGTNSLNAEAIADNFAIFVTLFRRASERAGISPRKLVFGSGFGIPYFDQDEPLDVEEVAARSLPLVDEFKRDPRFADAECVLEMGRWLVGPCGWLLTRVVAEKQGRGTDIRLCDAGFNNHLAACGMMGTVIRRNWRFSNVTNPEGAPVTCTLVGPLCTSIDILASNITLPEPRVGDVLAIANSGAYGLTASPTRFISHPEPVEIIVDGERAVDVTESRLNHWSTIPAPRDGTAARERGR
jgi:diaminopimelate decarboxylase